MKKVRSRIPTGWQVVYTKTVPESDSEVPLDCVHPTSVTSSDVVGACYYIEFFISKKVLQELQDFETPSGSQPQPGGSSSTGQGQPSKMPSSSQPEPGGSSSN